jgi:hypothetical protein
VQGRGEWSRRRGRGLCSTTALDLAGDARRCAELRRGIPLVWGCLERRRKKRAREESWAIYSQLLSCGRARVFGLDAIGGLRGVGLGRDTGQRKKELLTGGPGVSAAEEREGHTPSGSCWVGHGLKRSLGQNGSLRPFFFSKIFFLFCFSNF